MTFASLQVTRPVERDRPWPRPVHYYKGPGITRIPELRREAASAHLADASSAKEGSAPPVRQLRRSISVSCRTRPQRASGQVVRRLVGPTVWGGATTMADYCIIHPSLA